MCHHVSANTGQQKIVFFIKRKQNYFWSSRIGKPIKISSFNWARLSLGDFLHRNSKPFERYFAITFTKYAIVALKLYRDLLKKCVKYFSI